MRVDLTYLGHRSVLIHHLLDCVLFLSEYGPPSGKPYQEAGSIAPSAPPSASVAYAPASSSSGSFLDDFTNPDNVPAEFKKEGSDWFAVFNPKAKPMLDVDLLHTFMHERCGSLVYVVMHYSTTH